MWSLRFLRKLRPSAATSTPVSVAVENFLLVTGPMRSGTTLLGELLFSRAGAQRHPQLAFDNDRIDLIRQVSTALRQNHSPAIGTTDPFQEIPFQPGRLAHSLGR